MNDEIAALLQPLIVPTTTEVLRARKLIREALADGGQHSTIDLLGLLAKAENVGPGKGMSGTMTLDLPTPRASWRETITRDHSVARSIRYDTASIEALSDLVAMGLAIPVGEELREREPHHIAWSFSVNSSTLRLDRPLRQLHSIRYQLPYRLRTQHALPVEPDLFLADVAGLGLDSRTERTLREAIECFRRGLYLACASLLGATSEGAWYAFGERFRTTIAKLPEALDNNKSEQVQARLAQGLRDTGFPLKNTADELATTAAMFRGLRNYGVHPRGTVQPHLEPVFDEEACGMLLLNFHRYLTLMARAADALADAHGLATT